MSIRAMNWAWMQELAPSPKLILMALADAADDHGKCWPGIPYIAKKCCVSERTVQRTLQAFKTRNLVSADQNFAPSGRQTSNVYRLRLTTSSSPDKMSPSDGNGSEMAEAGVTHTGTAAPANALTPLEPQDETQQQPLQFPPQLSAAEHSVIASLVAPIAPQDAQALLDELADAIETKSIKTSPLRWFRAVLGRQRNGKFVPAGGVRISERRRNRATHERGQPPKNAESQTEREIAREKLAEVKRLVSKHGRTTKKKSEEK